MTLRLTEHTVCVVGERDRDRPKKSWREIDAGRDRSGGQRPPPGDRKPMSSGDHSSKQYRAALDALFAKGEVGKLAEKLSSPPPAAEPVRRAPAEPAPPPKVNPADEARAGMRKKIMAAIGREEISRAVDRYVKAYGMPADFEILEQALEHQKADRQREAVDALATLLGREKPKRSRTLAGKLRLIEETSDDADLKTAAAQVRAKLG